MAKAKAKGKGSSRRDALRKGVEANQEKSYKTKDSSGRFKTIFKDNNATMWKCGNGQHIIDIIPYLVGKFDPTREEGEGAYILDIWVHYGVGINEDAYVCMNLTGDMGKKCPVCEHRAKLERQGASKDEVKQFKSKRRALYNIVCYDSNKDEEAGVQVWDSPHYLTERQILEVARNPRTGRRIQYAHPDTGKSVAFNRTGEKAMTRFEGLMLQDRDEPISDDILEAAHALDELIHWPTYDEIADAFFGDNSEEDGPAESDAPIGGKKSSEEDEDLECPHDHTIGEDFNETDDCEDCDLYDDCGALSDTGKKKKSSKKKSKPEPEEEEEGSDEPEGSEDPGDDDGEDEDTLTDEDIRAMSKKELLGLIKEYELEVDTKKNKKAEDLAEAVIAAIDELQEDDGEEDSGDDGDDESEDPGDDGEEEEEEEEKPKTKKGGRRRK